MDLKAKVPPVRCLKIFVYFVCFVVKNELVSAFRFAPDHCFVQVSGFIPHPFFPASAFPLSTLRTVVRGP